MDGLLDEEAWAGVPPATGFKQREPLEGEDATERTEIRVVYDSETIYIGVIARDREPDKLISRILQRDRLLESGFSGPEFAGDDGVAILLDPFHDHRNAVVFATNPNGAEFEALITDEGREFNIDWRGVWRVESARTADGWSAEFAIPFRSLRYPTASDEPWGFNIFRIIRRKNEEALWSSWGRGDEGFARVSTAGHLEGLTDLPRTGLNVEVKPFLLGGGTQESVDPEGVSYDGQADVGLDLKYEVRPGLVLDATVNTDFAQVEVDDQQVNLTRFSLFFPEKRDFFLENSGVFEFGTRGGFEPPPFLMFFSRRVGISSDGEIPIIGGGRLTGRVGAQTVGLLNVVTDRREFLDEEEGDSTVVPRENFAVARIKRDIGANNYVGVMVTDRRGSDETNTVGGLDWSFWPDTRLNIQGFLARTQTAGDGGDDNAYRIGGTYQSNFLDVEGQHIFIGSEVNASSGFVLREDIRRTQLNVRVVPRPQLLGLRRVSVFSRLNHQTRTDGNLQDWRLSTGISPTWNSGDDFVIFYAFGFTRLDEAFDLADRVLIPDGDYDIWELGGFANSSPNRPVSVAVRGGYEGFFGGNRLELNADLTVSAGSHLSMTAGVTHNDVDVPGGSFAANVGRLRMTLAFSTKLVANTLLQYNSLDNEISANIRLNYIHRPGSDLFLVFTEERGSDLSIRDFRNRGLVAKITYLSRL